MNYSLNIYSLTGGENPSKLYFNDIASLDTAVEDLIKLFPVKVSISGPETNTDDPDHFTMKWLKDTPVAYLSLSLYFQRMWFESLNATSYLTNLHLVKCSIPDEEANLLSTALITNNSITNINLSECQISDDAISVLALAIKINQTVQKFSLLKIPLLIKGALAIKELIITNKVLQHLHLEENTLSDGELVHLANGMLNNCTIKTLDLSKNDLGNQSLAPFSAVLSFNTSLTIFNIGLSNDLNLEIFERFTKALGRNNSLQKMFIDRKPPPVDDCERKMVDYFVVAIETNFVLNEFNFPTSMTARRCASENASHNCFSSAIDELCSVRHLMGKNMGHTAVYPTSEDFKFTTKDTTRVLVNFKDITEAVKFLSKDENFLKITKIAILQLRSF